MIEAQKNGSSLIVTVKFAENHHSLSLIQKMRRTFFGVDFLLGITSIFKTVVVHEIFSIPALYCAFVDALLGT